MSVRYYDHTHPMVAKRTGDPARGEFTPKSKQQKDRGKKRGRRR